MCENCWKEAGSSAIINAKTLQAARLIEALYESEHGSVGGAGHIVFDDNNVGDGFIQYCLQCCDDPEYVKSLGEETIEASRVALLYFLTLTEDERVSALAINAGYINDNQ